MIELYKKALQEHVPELPIKNISLLGQGWMNTALLVNDQYVFRFANTEKAHAELKTEQCLLPKLQNILNLSVPDFLYSGIQSQNGFAFVGYKLLAGTPMTPHLFHALSNEEKRGIYEQLGDFLATMHSFDKEEAKRCGCREVNYKTFAIETLGKVKEHVFPMLQPNAQKRIQHLFWDYINEDAFFHFDPVLVYADTKPDHLLFDQQANKITGIIDWGNVRIGDPDHDLKHLYMHFGQEFIQHLFEFYPHQDPKTLWKKLAFFQKSDAVLGLLHGVTHGKTDFIERYLKDVTEG